jgi:hypothetical protein
VDEIDQQRAAYAEARLAGVDREEEEDAISKLDISEDELTTSLLHLRAETRTEFGLDSSASSSDYSDQGRPAPAVPAQAPIMPRARTTLLDRVRLDRERSLNPFRTTASGRGPAEQMKRRREARLLEEQMADTVDVTGVPWEDARAAQAANNQRMLERIQQRQRSEQRALEGSAHIALGGRGTAASANLGGP